MVEVHIVRGLGRKRLGSRTFHGGGMVGPLKRCSRATNGKSKDVMNFVLPNLVSQIFQK